MVGGVYSAPPDDLTIICGKVREKSERYRQYNFSNRYNDFLKAFFDLAQEFDSLEDFYRICVAVPLEMTDMECRLYLKMGKEQQLCIVCDSRYGIVSEPRPAGGVVSLREGSYETEGSFVIPICGRPMSCGLAGDGSIMKQTRHGCPNQTEEADLWPGCGKSCGHWGVLGMLEVSPLEELSKEDKFFFIKYANRIGSNLESRFIACQNADHLKFINTLVMDIEHNVIIPNIYYLNLFSKLKKKISEIKLLEPEVEKNIFSETSEATKYDCLKRCRQVHQELFACYHELVRHHGNVSMFLESLFRREHFEKGHLVLRTRCCFVEKEIIIPQLEHYGSRLRAANVEIRPPQNMIEEEFQLMVDIGLLSQVYANLFSNAVKYTKEVVEDDGAGRKFMAYGREIVDNFMNNGNGMSGVKFNVFTSGQPMSIEDGNRLFAEGVRGDDSGDVPGTGHGLSFIRYVVELHGGKVGHEPTPCGNNFYFILPLPCRDSCPVAMSESGK
jgi:hypothetical protein